MLTLFVAVLSFVGFIMAYHLYGRWLARSVFGLDASATVPSHQLRDDIDFVPTRKEVIFGHHFTSIAGTGPIVGPAIAVFWGWLPALLWVVFGSIFIGAVHDFSALVISLRNRGQTVGEIAGRLISPRARILFLLILFFALTVVLAIFGLVIATIFKLYPESVLSVWIEIPIAVAVGFWVYRKGSGLLIPSLIALALLYLAIYVGVYYLPISLSVSNPIVVWTLVLMTYCFIASVLPVWTLLQPRDFINSHQLLVALALLVGGLLVAALTGEADLVNSAPMIADKPPTGTPPIIPFLFITIACGAVSGFHCLVSSGTSSKQVDSETDAQYVGYGAMLLEGALAVIVILACCAGVGMGVTDNESGNLLTGLEAWHTKYDQDGSWASFGLGQKVGAFVDGGANFVHSLGIARELAVGIIAVLVASFAATTLDTATRLQRYVVQDLASTLKVAPLTGKYAATFAAVTLGAAMEMVPAPGNNLPITYQGDPKETAKVSGINTGRDMPINKDTTLATLMTANGPFEIKSKVTGTVEQVICSVGDTLSAGDPVMVLTTTKPMGTGGLILWPLFGAINQLLAGLAFMVTVFYLWRRNKPIWFAAVPMVIMIILPGWALGWQLFNPETGWWLNGRYLLFTIGFVTMLLQVWMVVEAFLVWQTAKGVLEEPLPSLPTTMAVGSGTRSG